MPDPDADTTPDAAEGGVCGIAAGTIAVPGSFSGDVIGGGADFVVAEGACEVEIGWYEQPGEDVVVDLTGLTVGTRYGVVVATTDDLGVYVATSCDATGPVTGECLAMTDAVATGGTETIYFTATQTTASVIVDNWTAKATTGAFTLSVDVAECIDESECSGDTLLCVNYECVECATSFDCTTAGESACDATGTCVAGVNDCTGDDAEDTASPADDGPASATAITLPTAGVPTVVNAAVCGTPASEGDWYTFTAAAGASYGVQLDWAATADLDLYVLDSTFAVVGSGAAASNTGPEAFRVDDLAAGTYYIYVLQYDPDTAPANAYTLTMSIPTCDDNFDCTTGAAPLCTGAGSCSATTSNACVGDDTVAEAASDDGPAGGTLLASGVAVNANICNSPGAELDWYRFVVASAGSSAQINLAWTDATQDLDIYVYDATGALYGMTFWLRPEVIDLTYLAAGTYYVMVQKYDPDSATTAVVPYTITATVTPQAGCTTNAECGAEYSTQFLRGVCNAGSCGFIPEGTLANGMPCDSGTDCASTFCSYIQFDADAIESVCTIECTTTADCAGIAGTACTAGLCRPTCATDLECGANVGSNMLDTGEPWNYGTCTVATGECAF